MHQEEGAQLKTSPFRVRTVCMYVLSLNDRKGLGKKYKQRLLTNQAVTSRAGGWGVELHWGSTAWPSGNHCPV